MGVFLGCSRRVNLVGASANLDGDSSESKNGRSQAAGLYGKGVGQPLGKALVKLRCIRLLLLLMIQLSHLTPCSGQLLSFLICEMPARQIQPERPGMGRKSRRKPPFLG